jgi:hypothetical protein
MASTALKGQSMTNTPNFNLPEIKKPIIAIVGGFGSGKTEVAVNLAKFMALNQKEKVTIVDLDLVNPYFRSREVQEMLAELDVTTIAPEGDQRHADLPILLPQVRGLIERAEGKLILDVGGDAQGTKALGSLAGSFRPDTYELLMVLNSRRPQTETAETSVMTMQRIEISARLKFTGLIANSHMIDDTDLGVIMEGYELSREVSKRRKLPVFFVSAKRRVLETMDLRAIDCPVLPLSRAMLKPWERSENNSQG